MSKGQAPGLCLIDRAEKHGQRTAIISAEGSFSYQRLSTDSARMASLLLEDHLDLDEARVAFLEPPGYAYAAVQWGIWRAGGITVPLSVSHPQPELEHVIQDSGAGIMVIHPCFEKKLRSIAEKYGCRLLLSTEVFKGQPGRLSGIDPDRRAMILYTSGTTSKPKGVVTTHKNIQAQVSSLVSAWEWRPDDHILGVLPLHHIHGIINVLTCALWSGAACEILPKFDPDVVWDCFLRGNLSLFMAVPTIYIKLISSWEKASPERKKALSEACSRIRLMVSGSAALPVTTLMRWKDITGHVLLERYGMTETGMILSNPLHGTRIPGCVGNPLSDIQVRLVDEAGEDVKPGIPGEILVKGPGVFREYWRNEEATEKAFRDGWFLTGDIAVQRSRKSSGLILKSRSAALLASRIQSGENVLPSL
jgi:malonyl-CoA/methylmalonyl-CoA synthetase